LLRPADDALLAEDRSWHAHDFEPWVAAWNYWDSNVFYTGGDDLKMKGWDIRQEPPLPIFTNSRFDGGVTSIQSNPHCEYLLAVGSYDSTVRLFDIRKPLVPLVHADVGGGAWRVKWHPSKTRRADLLVACMHDGFKIVRFSPDIIGASDEASGEDTIGNSNGWEIKKRFDEHESLAYGVDWSHAEGEASDETPIASCSFYDHVLQTWSG